LIADVRRGSGFESSAERGVYHAGKVTAYEHE
jgi:hypothetical protein